MKPILSISLIFLLCAVVQAQHSELQSEESTINENDVFTIVEQMPTFPGGEYELIRFMREQIRYPAEAKEKNISGTVFLSFIVDTTGALTKIKILRGVSDDIDAEAIRVLTSMPKWGPGRQWGKPVPVQFTLPIKFALMDPEKTLNTATSNDEKSRLAYEIGLKCFKENNFTEAIKYFTQSLTVPNEYEKDALFARGCSYYNLNDSTKACNDWKTGYHMMDMKAADKLEKYCGCFYNRSNNTVYFENAKEEKLRYVSEKENKSIYDNTNKLEFDSLNPVFTIVDVMPSFPGGEHELVKYLQKNIVYPTESMKNKITGTVFATFIVDKTGEIFGIRILRGINSELDAEVIRVIKAMPLWNPGKQNGKVVSVQFNLPIRYSLKH